MDPNQALYAFLKEKTWELTEEWYASIDKEAAEGIYASNKRQDIEKLKAQNHAFHERFCQIYIEDDAKFYAKFEEWVVQIASDEGHLETPSYLITQEFFNTQAQYLKMIQAFACSRKEQLPVLLMDEWKSMTINAFNRVISWFLKEQHAFEKKRLKEKQQTINKLSSPVIVLNKYVALLPLIGNIDAERGGFMLENTLEACSAQGIRRLLIDLSGVVKVDTMVAHQIFQLIEALGLIGVDATLSGIRPEIAQTAVSFGDRFRHMNIVPNLGKAMDLYLK